MHARPDKTTTSSRCEREGSGERRLWGVSGALKLTVDLLEHIEHALQVVMVQIPDGGILQVLLKWYCPATT